MIKTLRTFIALPLSDIMIHELDKAQQQLKRRCPYQTVRWVKPANIHLTLFFLGDILRERVAPVAQALSVVARHIQPFDFEVAGSGVFPNPNRPRVVWVGLKEHRGRLVLLHQTVNEALEAVGFPHETRPFSPHLTLGRIQRKAAREDARAVGQVIGAVPIGHLGVERVDKLILFRSVLKSTGAEYTALETFDLGIDTDTRNQLVS